MSNRTNPFALALPAFLLACLGIAPSHAEECGVPARAGIMEVGTALAFQSQHLNVDADGAPNAYLLDGAGLSYTCDGVVVIENGRRVTPKSDPKNWQSKCNAAWKRARETNDYSGVAIFGFATDSRNRPLVQQAGDPLPGVGFISTTAVVVGGERDGTQRRYIDASRIPYIVLSRQLVAKYGLDSGNIALVYRPSTGRAAFAVYGDSGGLGEGSVKLHQDLGSDPFLVKGGVQRAKRRIEDRVVTFVFRGAKAPPVVDSAAWNTHIQQQGQAALDAFGGMPKVEACAKLWQTSP